MILYSENDFQNTEEQSVGPVVSFDHVSLLNNWRFVILELL